jgi:hypothetical protein
MILTKNNIKEWKKILEAAVPGFSKTLSDKEWLDTWEGFSVDDVVHEEFSYEQEANDDD